MLIDLTVEEREIHQLCNANNSSTKAMYMYSFIMINILKSH